MSEEYKVEKPTPEQCSSNACLFRDERWSYYAAWYPQMGGYVGMAVIQIEKGNNNVCFDAFVWHDGEFPFNGEEGDQPRRLHHCEASQFVSFGALVGRLQRDFQ